MDGPCDSSACEDQAVQKQNAPHPAEGQSQARCLDGQKHALFHQNANSQEPGFTCGLGALACMALPTPVTIKDMSSNLSF